MSRYHGTLWTALILVVLVVASVIAVDLLLDFVGVFGDFGLEGRLD